MTRARNADHTARTYESLLILKSNNKIVWLSNMRDTFIEKFTWSGFACWANQHSQGKKAHIPLRTSWTSQNMSAMFDNRTIFLFWLYNEQTFRMFSLRNLPFLLCSLDLDVLRAQRIIGVFILITHKSTGSQNPITWSTSEPRSFSSFHKQVQEEFMVLNPRPFNIGHRQ